MLYICHLEAMAERQRGRSQTSRPVAFDACGRKVPDSDATKLIGQLGNGEGMTALAKLFARPSETQAERLARVEAIEAAVMAALEVDNG